MTLKLGPSSTCPGSRWITMAEFEIRSQGRGIRNVVNRQPKHLGRTFGRLRCIGHIKNSVPSTYRCECECGTVITVRTTNLISMSENLGSRLKPIFHRTSFSRLSSSPASTVTLRPSIGHLELPAAAWLSRTGSSPQVVTHPADGAG
jgi:hypothetical protein